MWQFVWERAVTCLTGPHKWSYLAIPLVGAFIGWFTNWKATQADVLPQEILGHCAVSRLAGHRAAQGGKKWPAWLST